MYATHDGESKRRIGAAAATVAVHALVIAGLAWGLSFDRSPVEPTQPLAVTVALDEPPPPPRPPVERSEPQRTPDAAPAPEGQTGDALLREAPSAAIPLAVAPAAPVAGDGRDVDGGSGTQGSGSGAGGSGTGEGGGGSGTPAQRIAGALRDSDYPRAAEQAGLAGTVAISFRVRTDGSVDRCEVVRSSGAELLDGLTCRLFTQRFRFRPATDAAGQPIDSTLQTSFTWGTRRRR